MSFPYKTALITGATSGLGLALAERLASNGVFVIAVGRRADRLETLAAKFGEDHVAAESFDVCDLAALPAWWDRIIKTYPTLDCLMLNAGIQRTLNFTSPETISLATVDAEVLTNYTSPLHLLIHALPHLISLGPSTPTCVVLVTSGLALVPLPRCAGYCATKAAMHSLSWTLRAQLSSPENASRTGHVKVVEIVPPAVKTELHSVQPDLVAIGQGDIGMPLQEFLEEAWTGLQNGEEDIYIGAIRERFANVEKEKKVAFKGMVEAMRKMGAKA